MWNKKHTQRKQQSNLLIQVTDVSVGAALKVDGSGGSVSH